jgi:hypothetical protein
MDLSDFRQAREYAAWLLLAAAVIVVGMGLWFLLGLPGSGGGTLADHGFAAAPDLIGVTVTLLPVAAVLLAALGGPAVGSLRQITLYAVVVQVVALILGVIAWLITFGGRGRAPADAGGAAVAGAVAVTRRDTPSRGPRAVDQVGQVRGACPGVHSP